MAMAPTGISPANSPAVPGPIRGSASYQRRNATVVTTTAWYARPAASAADGTRSIAVPSASHPVPASSGTASTDE